MSHPPHSQPERFIQLDAMRFFFAVIVVLVHTIGFRLTLIHGGYAVDFFFILSGFVLSHALYSDGSITTTHPPIFECCVPQYSAQKR